MIIRFWAWLTNGKLVWLQDFDGEVTLSIARPNPFGGMVAERHWPFNIRKVYLLPNGDVIGSYVRKWKECGGKRD